MKLIHLSDFHIGKRVNEFSMLEDQEYILTKIINVIDDEKPDGVMIAGDIYDKSVPSAEAVQLFDDFLVRLSKRGLKVFIISGNHDSPERIAFGSRLMNSSGVYMSPVYDGSVEPIAMADSLGTVNVFLLPFIKPAHVKRYYPEEEITTYSDAIQLTIGHMEIDPENRNVLITHQFVTGALRCDSEDINVGGSDSVDVNVFAPFDYVALGHIHSPQNVGSETVRYCGTPLKYSFSEAKHSKSVTVVELQEKGNVVIRTIPLVPKRDLIEIKGTYMEVTSRSFYSDMDTNAYLHITLTDEEDIPDAIGKLQSIYPNIMKLDYDNRRTRTNAEIIGADDMESKTPIELFSEFYEKQNNQPISAEQGAFMSELIEKIWGEAK
ncbi:MAG: exonuclease SbcCD subunit D [Oscillospiraceae bacterium]|nr:exonuclease SbcCD subunit D [Oscillospiraceae bacterium]